MSNQDTSYADRTYPKHLKESHEDSTLRWSPWFAGIHIPSGCHTLSLAFALPNDGWGAEKKGTVPKQNLFRQMFPKKWWPPITSFDRILCPSGERKQKARGIDPSDEKVDSISRTVMNSFHGNQVLLDQRKSLTNRQTLSLAFGLTKPVVPRGSLFWPRMTSALGYSQHVQVYKKGSVCHIKPTMIREPYDGGSKIPGAPGTHKDPGLLKG